MKRGLKFAGILISIVGAILLSIGVSITATTHDPAAMRLWWVRIGPWLFVLGLVLIAASVYVVDSRSRYDRRRNS
jgi:uncharacterized membrane protein YkvI